MQKLKGVKEGLLLMELRAAVRFDSHLAVRNSKINYQKLSLMLLFWNS